MCAGQPFDYRSFIFVEIHRAVVARHLHFDVQYRPFLILHIHIKPYALATDSRAVDMSFCYEIADILDLYVQNPFNQVLAEFFVFQHLLKHIIIYKR